MDIVESNFVLYKTEDGKISVDIVLKNETVWLTQKSMAELFGCSSDNISLHLKNIYATDELDEPSTTEKISVVQKEGNRNVRRNIEYYNLDAIIAVGYRVNSKKATQFRIWATKVLKEYIIKGFALDDEKFLKGGRINQEYFNELLERIKVIRTSERMAYQKITDIFMNTSIDYDKNSDEAYTFFKIVQNKLHYAITGHTAAELIYERVDAEKINMGLTNWKESPNGMIYKFDISIAKNYLTKEELEKLNDLTNLFLDVAETEAKEQQVMTMEKWIEVADDLLKYRKKKVLDNAGQVSHEQAIEKANDEYEKYRKKQDEQYISSMDQLYIKYLKESREEYKVGK